MSQTMIPCNWRLYLCGINHTTSSLEEREPLQINIGDLAAANAVFVELPEIKESMIVSTCNRIEFYFIAGDKDDAFKIISDFYRNFRDIDITSLKDKFYLSKDKDAVDHIFRVAAGIESMVIGENQIFGQIKDAYRSACSVKSTGKVLHRLIHQTFRIGKQVRTETELGKGACSVSSATIDLLRIKLQAFDNPVILFVGINRMISLAASGLHRLRYNNFLFANRTRDKAEEFARHYNAEGFGFNHLPDLITKSDVVISCTGSDKPVIDDSILKAVFDDHPDKKMVIADMAVPRDVEVKANYDGLEIYDLDAVRDFLKGQQANRRRAIPDAEKLIKNRLEQFMYWYEHIRHEPGYNGLAEAFEKIRLETLGGLNSMPDETKAVFDRISRQMMDRMIQVKSRVEARAEKMEN
ncbi:MAG: glutamyl-tRNA reductase [Candidatus Zixiibacteriota bacterium]